MFRRNRCESRGLSFRAGTCGTSAEFSCAMSRSPFRITLRLTPHFRGGFCPVHAKSRRGRTTSLENLDGVRGYPDVQLLEAGLQPFLEFPKELGAFGRVGHIGKDANGIVAV